MREIHWSQVDSPHKEPVPVPHSDSYHINHGTSADSGWTGLGQIVHLKHQPHAGRQTNPLSVGQTQDLGVIQHRVEILHPDGVHRAIQDDPLPVEWDRIDAGVAAVLVAGGGAGIGGNLTGEVTHLGARGYWADSRGCRATTATQGGHAQAAIGCGLGRQEQGKVSTDMNYGMLAFRWVSARKTLLQCGSNGVTSFLH